jgi:hypothetical protein
MTPLFKTQPNGFELGAGQDEEEEEEECEDNDSIKNKKNFKKKTKKSSRNQSVMSSVSSVDINDKIGSSMSKSSQRKSNGDKTSISNESNSVKKGDKKNNKDFIKRNIQVKFD